MLAELQVQWARDEDLRKKIRNEVNHMLGLISTNIDLIGKFSTELIEEKRKVKKLEDKVLGLQFTVIAAIILGILGVLI